MSVYKLRFLKQIPNMFGCEMRNDYVIAREIWKNAFAMGNCYNYNPTYPTWEYYLKSVTKPALKQAFMKYLEHHRANYFRYN